LLKIHNCWKLGWSFGKSSQAYPVITGQFIQPILYRRNS
jgi:hypothetical protein